MGALSGPFLAVAPSRGSVHLLISFWPKPLWEIQAHSIKSPAHSVSCFYEFYSTHCPQKTTPSSYCSRPMPTRTLNAHCLEWVDVVFVDKLLL